MSKQLLERVKEYVLGLEVAADCERRIFAGYKPEWDLWETRNADPDFKSDDRLVHMIRNALDARNNAEKYERQAEAIQALLVENERLREHRDFWLRSWSELQDAAASLISKIDALKDGQSGPFAIRNSVANSSEMDALRATLEIADDR